MAALNRPNQMIKGERETRKTPDMNRYEANFNISVFTVLSIY